MYKFSREVSSAGSRSSGRRSGKASRQWKNQRSASCDIMVARPDFGALGFCMAFDAGDKDKKQKGKKYLFRISDLSRNSNCITVIRREVLRPFKVLVSQKFAAVARRFVKFRRSYGIS
jgi:hypothetical protein